jgi:hypothetical protein
MANRSAESKDPFYFGVTGGDARRSHSVAILSFDF